MNCCGNRNFKSKRILFFILIIPILFFGIGTVVMLLWNAILPELIHVGVISFWQAIGLLVLSKILFSSFRHSSSGRHMHSYGKYHHLKEKWENMTDEEKAKYKSNWKNCCSPDKQVEP